MRAATFDDAETPVNTRDFETPDMAEGPVSTPAGNEHQLSLEVAESVEEEEI
jgi:hypothetical protein